MPLHEGGVVSPLQGIKVLDLTRFLAGPYAAWVLSELGASVIKIEDYDRPDEARRMGPYFKNDQSLYFAALNTGKRSFAVRMNSNEGREAILALAKTADVVIDNQKPGTLDKLGLGAQAFRDANPSIIVCSLSGYGATGPKRHEPAYDYTIQAVTGVMSMTGEPTGPPGKAGISYVDHTGGLSLALAVCAALVGRCRTGVGGIVDLSLYEVQVSMLSYLAAWNLNAGWVGQRTTAGAHQYLVPAQNFETSDGYVTLFVGHDAMWARLADGLRDAELRDPKFATAEGRRLNRDSLLNALSKQLRQMTTERCVRLLTESGVPCEPVNDLSQALAESQVRARHLVDKASHPAYGEYRYVSGPIPDLRSPQERRLPAPLLGEHSAEVLIEAGVSPPIVAELLRTGTVFDTSSYKAEE